MLFNWSHALICPPLSIKILTKGISRGQISLLFAFTRGIIPPKTDGFFAVVDLRIFKGFTRLLCDFFEFFAIFLDFLDFLDFVAFLLYYNKNYSTFFWIKL